jgi:hypothetical protein
MRWKMMFHKNLSSERFLANRTYMPKTKITKVYPLQNLLRFPNRREYIKTFILVLILGVDYSFMVQKLSPFLSTVGAELACKLPILWNMANSFMSI